MPLILIEVREDISIETYHCGTSCNISSLTSNKILQCKLWSCLTEVTGTTFLENKEIDHKKNFLRTSDWFHLAMSSKHAHTLASICLKRSVLLRTFQKNTETRVKLLKIA